MTAVYYEGAGRFAIGESERLAPGPGEGRLRRRRLVEAKLGVGEVISIVVGGVVRAPKVQFVGHVVVPAVGVLQHRNVTGQSVYEDEEPAYRTALGTRVVSCTLFATRSAACVEHELVRDRVSHLLQKQTTSDPYELARQVTRR